MQPEDRLTGFQNLVSRVIRDDLRPATYTTHPSLDLLLADMSGELPPEEHTRLSSHLALCPQCRTRLAYIQSRLHVEQGCLPARLRAATLPAFMEKQRSPREHPWVRRVVEGVRRLPSRPVYAWGALPAAVAAVLLAVLIPSTLQVRGLRETVGVLERQLAERDTLVAELKEEIEYQKNQMADLQLSRATALAEGLPWEGCFLVPMTADLFPGSTGALVPEGSQITAVAWKPNGTIVVTGSRDGTLRAWDSRTGRLVGSAHAEGTPVTSLLWALARRGFDRDTVLAIGLGYGSGVDEYGKGVGYVGQWDIHSTPDTTAASELCYQFLFCPEPIVPHAAAGVASR